MTYSEISKLRLINQKIAVNEFLPVKELAGWMGALQAQDFMMSKWAVGVRIPDSSDNIIQSAIDKGEIIRTHLLRPTWHLVSSDDIRWMLDLTAPHINSNMRSRDKELGLTESICNKCNILIFNALSDNKNMTREEILTLLKNEGIDTGENRSSHIFMKAELDGLICSGASKGNKQTYALLDERVRVKNKLSREDSLKMLAERYFTSHGPATISDFIWWSGLPAKDARNALEMIKNKLLVEKANSSEYWFKENKNQKTASDNIHLLPAYDEFIISYRDRSASITHEDHKKAVSINGFFRPVLVVDGQIAGVWQRNTVKEKLHIGITLFKSLKKTIHKEIKMKVMAYGSFLGKKIEDINITSIS